MRTIGFVLYSDLQNDTISSSENKWDWPVYTAHRVGRVLSLFLQSSELGLPQPLTHAGERAPPPPLVPGWGAHSLAREGVGESQFQGGDMGCGTLYIYVLCDTAYTLPSWGPGRLRWPICVRRKPGVETTRTFLAYAVEPHLHIQ